MEFEADIVQRKSRSIVSDSLSNDSYSESVNETVNGSHEFKITDYSQTIGMEPGKYLSSDIFTVGGYQWAIYFYPDGKSHEDNSLYVSVFVVLASDNTDVRALFELTLLDQSGKGKHKVHSQFDRVLESGPYTMKCKESMWGYKRFFRRAALESSDFLKDDCLAIHCTVGVVRIRSERPNQYSISIPPSDMGQCLKGILESGISSDIAFEVGDETFKAHKLIIAARSPVFRDQFFGPNGNPNMDKVVVEDIEPPVFKAMLQFMYSDELSVDHELMSSVSMCTSTIMVQHLLAVADLYGLGLLKLLCEAKLCEEISSDTVAAMLALAEKHCCAQLKSVCLKLAAAPSNLGVVMKSEGFGYLEDTPLTLPSELLETVAVIDDDTTSPTSKKRSNSSNIGFNLEGRFDPNGRRVRSRL